MPYQVVTQGHYLPTQFVCEYLWTQANPRFDGLIYGSSQLSNSANNIVLFPHATSVQGYTNEVGDDTISLSSSSGDADRGDYVMFEGPEIQLDAGFVDLNKATLRLLVDEIVTSHVQAISYEVEERTVHRIRMPLGPVEF